MKEVKRTKEEHYRNLYDKIRVEADTKKLFKLTGELLDIRSGNLPQRFLIEGRVVSKPNEMSNSQLDFYNTKVENLIKNLPNSDRDPLRYLKEAMNTWEERDARPIFHFREINKTDVLKLIGSLSNSEAFGVDEIDALALKSVAQEISEPLIHLNQHVTGHWKICSEV